MSDIENSKTGFVIGTAGHIDHGKSSLVLALCGKDPDRLEEEKKRGITITLGFAELELAKDVHASVVDVPGHERFVREMIAGATGIDIALLCIAVDDGIMPQTKEHLNVIELLGIPTLVVALTKCDVADSEWCDMQASEISNFLLSTQYGGSEIIQVSSKTMQGIDELKAALLRATKKTTRHIYGDVARQPVDRVFTIKGAGTVITGTLWSGEIKCGDSLEILPSKREVKVRSIQIHDQPKDSAYAGNRVALNLNGATPEQIRPGNMLCAPGVIEPSDTFNVEFSYIASADGAKPLKNGSQVHLSHGTKESVARIFFFNGQKSLDPGCKAFAQIRSEDKLPVSWRDRFIVRSYSPVEVIGGGVVLNAHPRRNTNLKESEEQLLNALTTSDVSNIAKIVFQTSPIPLSISELIKICGMTKTSCEEAIHKLKENKEIIKISATDEIYCTSQVLTQCQNTIINALKRFHIKDANATGISKDYLKNLSYPKIDDKTFLILLDSLENKGEIIIESGEISHRSAGMGAKSALGDAKAKIEKILLDAKQTPPFIKDIASTAKIDTKTCSKALTSLEREKTIVRIGHDFYFHKDVIDSLKDKIINCIKNGGGSVADIKEAIDVSRKYAVPILEYCDKIGLTKREGDVRILSKK